MSIVRGPAALGERSVANYADPPADLDLRNATIVICAGAVSGAREELQRANVDVPKAWGQRSLDGGARNLVQISSFSIFGGAESIGTDTPINPVSHYGETKLTAEHALQAFSHGSLSMTMLRVPILVGNGNDKLAKLAGLARRTGIAMYPPWPVPRSMLSYDGLACAVDHVLQPTAPAWQALFAADPEPFTPHMMIEEAEAVQRRLRAMPVPRPFLKIVEKVIPGLYASLFRPSYLDPRANLLAHGRDFSRLRTVLRAMLHD